MTLYYHAIPVAVAVGTGADREDIEVLAKFAFTVTPGVKKPKINIRNIELDVPFDTAGGKIEQPCPAWLGAFLHRSEEVYRSLGAYAEWGERKSNNDSVPSMAAAA